MTIYQIRIDVIVDADNENDAELIVSNALNTSSKIITYETLEIESEEEEEEDNGDSA